MDKYNYLNLCIIKCGIHNYINFTMRKKQDAKF